MKTKYIVRIEDRKKMYLHESRPAVYLKKREEICIYTMYSR